MHIPSLVLATIAATCLLTSPPSAGQRLNDTGQIVCYNDTASTGTVSPGTPDPETAGFNAQDCTRGAAAADALGRMVKVGGSSVAGRDYSKIANDGSVLAADAMLGTGPGDWACTRDNITGLIWEIKTDDNGLRDKDWTYTWFDTDGNINGGSAGSEAGAGCNGTLVGCNTTAYRDAVNLLSVGLCGATDWRLPTVNELIGLVNGGAASDPAIDAVWFPNTMSGNHWSGETSALIVTFGWIVDFSASFPPSFILQEKINTHHVRLVRGEQ